MHSVGSTPLRLLVVDDNPGDSYLVGALLKAVGGFIIDEADTMRSALAKIARTPPDAVLLDLSLPDASGLATIDMMRREAPDLPLIVFTGLDDEAMAMAAVQHGCQDYLVKGQGDGHSIRRTILYAIERKTTEIEREHATARLKNMLRQTVGAISRTLEFRDPYTAGHQRRVAQLAVSIGRKLRFDNDRLEGLYMGALIHDIGKIIVPADFLSRPGRLSESAMGVVRTHSETGYEIIKDIDFPWPVAEMVLRHHERIDGTGYPGGLIGDAILPEARIICVADVVEAMASHRPYRPALGLDAALTEVCDWAGRRYDPVVVEACTAVIDEMGVHALDEAVAPG
jgi:putative two-component system response regulator